MLNTQDSRNESRHSGRFFATLVFVLTVAVGYAIAPHVYGAVSLANAVEDQDTAGEYEIDGLAFEDMDLDF